MSLLRTRALLCTAMLMAPLPAAAAVDSTGAEALRAQLQEEFNSGLPLINGPFEDMKLETSGQIVVTPMKGYYAITFPHLTAIYSESKSKLDIGVLTMNAMPGTTDKQWKATIALPTPIRLLNAADQEEMRIEINDQKISLIHDGNYSLPMMFDMNLGNIKMTAANDPVGLTVESLSAKWSYAEDGGTGVWSGPTAIHLKNLNVTGKIPAQDSLSLGDVSLTGEMRRLDMNKYTAYQAKMAELQKAGFNPDKGMSPESMAAFWSTISEYGFDQAEGYDFSLALSDLNIKTKDGKDDTPLQFTVGKIGYGLKSDRQDTNTAQGVARFSYNDLKIVDTPADTARFVPTYMNLDFYYQNLPYKKMLEQIGKLATQGMAIENPKKKSDAKMTALQSMMTMPAIMADSGTSFSLKNSRIGNDVYDLNVDGKFDMAPNALYGGAGGIRAVFSGMDVLVSELLGFAKKPDTNATYAQQATQAAQALSGIMMFGQQGTGMGGKPARIYDLSVDAAGVATLNGNDLATAMGFIPGPAGNPPLAPAQTPAK